MRLDHIIYDILEIKNAASDDSDVDELWLLNKINNYRAAFIQEQYMITGDINPSWLQRYPVFNLEKVRSSDDPTIKWGSLNLGKFVLPPLISLPFDQGLYQFFGASRTKPFSTSDFVTMVYRASLGEDIPPGSGFVARMGNDVYVYPFVMKGQAYIIAVNPMDVQVSDNGVLREMRADDDYPIDAAMAQNIVLSILTKDLQILDQSVSDIINDSQDQLKIVKTDGGIKEQG